MPIVHLVIGEAKQWESGDDIARWARAVDSDAATQALADIKQELLAYVEELDKTKLKELLRLRCQGSISDAVADLGSPDDIGRMFVGFQKWLYGGEQQVA